MIRHAPLPQKFRASDHFIHRANTELRHDFANLLRDSVEKVDDVFRFAFEFCAQPFVLGRDANGARV